MSGKKHDEDKAEIWRILQQFPLALEQVTRCSMFGHSKYELNGDWQNFSRLDNAYDRFSNSLCRHIMEGGLNDESGLDNDAHVAWNALARLEVKLRKEREDGSKRKKAR